MLSASDAVLLTAVIAVIALILAWYARRRGRPAPHKFHAGPSNLGLYDHPYWYPAYPGRGAVQWDVDRRCAAYCASDEPPCGPGGCGVWCR
jgi:hypothetical protein